MLENVNNHHKNIPEFIFSRMPSPEYFNSVRKLIRPREGHE